MYTATITQDLYKGPAVRMMVLASIQPANTHAGEQIQLLLDTVGIEYTTSINATLLFENHTVLNNVYVINPKLIPEETLTLIRLLAHSITEIDIDYDDLQHWRALLPTLTNAEDIDQNNT